MLADVELRLDRYIIAYIPWRVCQLPVDEQAT
jgi:hypothetical protein